MKELTSRPREDGKRRVQILIPDNVYRDFTTSLIDEYGHVDYRLSEVSSDLWSDFASNQRNNNHADFQIKKKYLIKLKKTIEKLITYKKDISEDELFDLFEETTTCVDERTYRNYRKILRKAEVLGKPERVGVFKCLIIFPINVKMAKEIIEDLKKDQKSKDYQKKKISKQNSEVKK